MFHLVIALTLAVATPAEGKGAGLPDDARLAPVRERLQQIVGRVESDGLPSEMIISKVREGLAKGVDPARIEAAATRLADNLGAARRYVSERRPGAVPVGLVRAVAEARMAGVSESSVDPLVRGARPEAQVRRAIEVVTDLSLRGYPVDRAAVVVGSVLSRDERSIDRLPGTLETIRHDYALTRAEAVDALARGLTSADSLQSAYARTAEDERRRGNGRPGVSDDRGNSGDSPGKSALAPGHLKARGGPPPKKMK